MMPKGGVRGGARSGRVTALVQVEDPNFDLSGDIGAIGRLVAMPPSAAAGGPQLILDLKGHQYAGVVAPCATMLVVGVCAP